MARIPEAQSYQSPSQENDRVMRNLLFGKNIISTKDMSLAEIELVMATATKLKQQAFPNLLQDKIIAHCFFEPSTRTRLSFESATYRLGGKVIGFTGSESLSIQKGETLSDTMRVISHYADLIILRHPKEGAARLVANLTDKPIINAGDGANQHPTQALIDLFTILASQGNLENLSIGLVGDLKYARTIHSLAQLCMLYNMRLFLVAPEVLTLPESIANELKGAGIRFSFHEALEEVIPKLDILYMTRIQQERFNPEEYQAAKKQCVLRPEMLSKAKATLKILHPLPRLKEIDPRVDATPHAYYFEQAANGVYVRQALLSLLLNETLL